MPALTARCVTPLFCTRDTASMTSFQRALLSSSFVSPRTVFQASSAKAPGENSAIGSYTMNRFGSDAERTASVCPAASQPGTLSAGIEESHCETMRAGSYAGGFFLGRFGRPIAVPMLLLVDEWLEWMGE